MRSKRQKIKGDEESRKDKSRKDKEKPHKSKRRSSEGKVEKFTDFLAWKFRGFVIFFINQLV